MKKEKSIPKDINLTEKVDEKTFFHQLEVDNAESMHSSFLVA